MERQVKKENKRKKRLRRKLASMTAMVLVLMVGILGTLAYLSTVSNKKENTFTGSKGISLKLTEPGWDPDDDPTNTPAPGSGEDEASNYTPGKEITKDPTLTNTTALSGDANAQEWVAIAVTYQVDGKNVSYGTLKNLIEAIEYNEEDWVLLEPTSDSDGSGYAIYMYKTPLKPSSQIADAEDGKGEETNPLFETITIQDSEVLEVTGLPALNTALSPETEYTVNGGLPTFKINMIGAAVKNEYYGWSSDAYTENLASSLDDLKDEDKTDLQSNLLEVLKKQLEQDGTLGYVTK